ncbi:hypothetical protein [Neorickettsia sp. 179522]|nr:hypothetical protein [Neorickettsia sp. 179522]
MLRPQCCRVREVLYMAKVASKTNPGRQKGSKATKTYNGRPVQPSLYIHRHTMGKNISYMGAEYENGDPVESDDSSGMPVRWDSI